MVIYKTTNLINDKFYIGQDFNNNPDYFGSGLLLKKAIKKYGKENFKKEILCHCANKQELNQKEIYWINKLNSLNKKIGYNISTGGHGGDTFTFNPNKEQIIQNIKNIFNNPDIKQKHRLKIKIFWNDPIRSKQARKILKENSKKRIGHIISDNTKKLISLNHSNVKGKNNPNYYHLSNNEKQSYYDLVKNGFSAYKISKIMNHPRCRVMTKLKELGLKTKKQIPKNKIIFSLQKNNFIKELYNDGVTYKELYKIFKVKQKVIQRILYAI